MHQDPEHEDYDDDEYNYYPQYSDYDSPLHSKKFKFDWAIWESWLSDALKDIVNEKENVWLIGGNKSNLLYIGNNQYKEPMWKSKYFVSNKMQQEYINHLVSHAAHVVRQPSFYKQMFDIMN